MDNLPELLVEWEWASDLVSAKNLIRCGGIMIDGVIVDKEEVDIPVGSKIEKVAALIKVGKRNHILVRL